MAHCGAAAAYATLGSPENAYFEWKSVLPYTEDEVQARFRVEPQGQEQLIVGLLSPETLPAEGEVVMLISDKVEGEKGGRPT